MQHMQPVGAVDRLEESQGLPKLQSKPALICRPSCGNACTADMLCYKCIRRQIETLMPLASLYSRPSPPAPSSSLVATRIHTFNTAVGLRSGPMA